MTERAPISLYLHIPFCSLKCSYCDFNSYAKLDDLVPAFVEALCAELSLWAPHVAGRPVRTVFFGGGTPSLLPLPNIQRILAALHKHYDLIPGAEVSLEANPGTADRGYFAGLIAAGVNRLSLGFQSMHDDELAALDRIHNAAEAVQCYRWAREAGFERVSVDLMYGLPDQPMRSWQETVDRALELAPNHISAYALTVEDGTKLAYDVEHGNLPGPDGDVQAEMYEWAQDRFATAGYHQYEISNWALPGEECRHNLVYWQNGEWLGLGPGAHSHWSGFRFADVYSPKQYVRLLTETVAPAPGTEPGAVLEAMRQVTFIDPQPPALQMADTAILALRLNDGLDLGAFERRFGQRFEDRYAPVLAETIELGLLERSNGRGRVRLTARGRYLANEVFMRLLPD